MIYCLPYEIPRFFAKGGQRIGTQSLSEADADPVAPDDAVHGNPADGLPGASGIHRGGGTGEPGAGAGGVLRQAGRVFHPAAQAGVAGVHRPPEPVLPPAGHRGGGQPPEKLRHGGGRRRKPLLLCPLPAEGAGAGAGGHGRRDLPGGESEPERLAGRASGRPGRRLRLPAGDHGEGSGGGAVPGARRRGGPEPV